MKIFYLLLFCSLWANDHYVLKGNFDYVNIYQHEDMILMKNMAASLIEQPKNPKHSHLSDISRTDMVLSLHKHSYVSVSHDQDKLLIDCYDIEDDTGRFYILLDSGHGGKDTGAVTKSGLKEKHVTLAYTKKLQKHLEHPLLKIGLTRTHDTHVDKYDRLKMVLEENPYLLFSIHADAYIKPEASGVGLFYLDESTGSNLSQKMIKPYGVNQNKKKASKKLANQIVKGLAGHYKLHVHHALSLPLVILRSPVCLSILLELGFISNPREAALLSNENYLDGFASDMANLLITTILENEKIIFTAKNH
jgi:N-acetylmuramoyl-L-alanine amidase